MTTEIQAPTVGRIVLAHIPGQSHPCAAIVTFILPGREMEPSLGVFDPASTYRAFNLVPYGLEASRGIRWSWPPRS